MKIFSIAAALSLAFIATIVVTSVTYTGTQPCFKLAGVAMFGVCH